MKSLHEVKIYRVTRSSAQTTHYQTDGLTADPNTLASRCLLLEAEAKCATIRWRLKVAVSSVGFINILPTNIRFIDSHISDT